jgi:HPt (histidine-containing phosphotransfer) domain-containing protein
VSEVDQVFEALRRDYLAEGPLRVAELRQDLAALRAGEPGAGASLRARFHRLAGSGGSYGFPEISAISREAELTLVAHPAPDASVIARLEESIARVAAAFGAAAEGP